jgi:hypothetical protein
MCRPEDDSGNGGSGDAGDDDYGQKNMAILWTAQV